ncbi:MAG: cytochrome c peroxidase, partial [Bacteroidota bacterium]
MRPFRLTILLVVFATGCQMMEDPFELSPNQELNQLIEAAGGKAAFTFPASDDFAAIPQDPKNPLTAEKVRLGQLLFHETGIGLGATTDGGLNTFSCASCHFAGAGFQAGRMQGIGEGGSGFGFNGERRAATVGLLPEDLDVQPIRTPAALNVAYQEVMLWNGQFGGTGMNEGTEANWTADTPKEKNWLGFQGVETQALAGLGVHRLKINEDIVDTLGYRLLFDAAFPHIPPGSRYELLPAALAIAAYERTLL